MSKKICNALERPLKEPSLLQRCVWEGGCVSFTGRNQNNISTADRLQKEIREPGCLLLRQTLDLQTNVPCCLSSQGLLCVSKQLFLQ